MGWHPAASAWFSGLAGEFQADSDCLTDGGDEEPTLGNMTSCEPTTAASSGLKVTAGGIGTEIVRSIAGAESEGWAVNSTTLHP